MGLLNFIQKTIQPPDIQAIASAVLQGCIRERAHGKNGSVRILSENLDRLSYDFVSHLTWNEGFDKGDAEKLVKSRALAISLCYISNNLPGYDLETRRIKKAFDSAIDTVLTLAEQDAVFTGVKRLYESCSRFYIDEKYHISAAEEKCVNIGPSNDPRSEHRRLTVCMASWFIQSLHNPNPKTYEPFGYSTSTIDQVERLLCAAFCSVFDELKHLLS